MVKYSAEEKEQMLLHVEGCAKSGNTIISYCKEHGIKEHVFHYWKKVYGKKKKGKGSFVPLSIASTPPSEDIAIEVFLSVGIRIRFAKVVPVEYIKSLCCI
jgi:transposase-like protein